MSLPLRQVTTNRLWQGLPVKQLTNTETGQSELFLNQPGVFDFLTPDTKFAEVGANNEWTITNKSELLRVYNNKARTTGGNAITEEELTRLFNTDGVKTFNNDRADVINKNSPTNTKTFLSTKPNPVPGVIDPASNTRPGADGRRVSTGAAKEEQKDTEGGNPIPSAADDSTNEPKFDLTELEKISAKPPRASYGNLRYPLKMNTDNREKQDVIKFTMIEYTPSLKFSKGEGEEGNSFALGRKGTAESTRGTVTLPIQPTIVDSNSVNWQEDSINSLMLAAADVSTGFIKGGSGGLTAAIERVLGTFKEEGIGNATNALTAAAASAALGNNIFTRATGAILNPNMELLFNGPSLRQFSYSFNLSARSAPESKAIQKIIRFFKQGMSVQRSPGELFLVTPDIFKIQYLLKGGTDHPYINRIKTCALTNCSVDYTPTGSYMTFEDGAMVSYTLNLSFEELEPIYHDDYDALDKDEIGF